MKKAIFLKKKKEGTWLPWGSANGTWNHAREH